MAGARARLLLPDVRTVRPLLLTTLLLAGPAAAQPAPAGARVLGAWMAAQRAAAAQAGVVRYEERATRTVDGPGQRHTFYTQSEVRRGPAGVRRRLTFAEADGWEVAPQRLARMERRMAHALGPEGRLTHPEALATLLQGPEAAGAARATMWDGRPAWEIDLAARVAPGARRRFDHGVLWLDRGGPPRLLAARFERRLPAGGGVVVDAEFTRVAGLDLPLRHTVEADVRQRRRTRWFAVLVRTEVDYSGWQLGR